MQNRVDAVTLVTEKSLNYLKVSLASFVQRNPWFKDTIYLVSVDSSTYTEGSLTDLLSLYKDVKFVEALSIPELKGIVQKNISTDSLDEILKLAAFYLNKDKCIYFSNRSLFLQSIVDFLPKENSISVQSFTEKGSPHFMMISKKMDKGFISSFDREFSNGADFLLYFHKSLEGQSKVEYLSSTLLLASKYPDLKYIQKKRDFLYTKGIVFDTLDFEPRKYTKINQVWLQNSHAVSKLLSRPVFRRGRKIIKKNASSVLPSSKEKIADNLFFERLAIYSTLNENYVKHAIVAFQTFRDQNPHLNLDFFVISKKLSTESLTILRKNSISHIEKDLSSVYKTEKGWPYPSECFWLFKGPDIFYEMGYKYSMYIDADVQCNRPMNLNWLNSLELIGGAHRGTTLSRFIENIDNLGSVLAKFKIDIKEIKTMPSINSGVLFFNNEEYVKKGFYEKTVKVFSHSKKVGLPRKGDDSLLCLTMSIYNNYPYHVLPNTWNDYKFYNRSKQDHFNSIIVHNFRQKPWAQLESKHRDNPFVLKFVSDWHKTFQKLIANGKL